MDTVTKQKTMTETHPFKEFIPNKSYVLLLGSFPGKESTQNKREGDWYYGANRNQFWKILEEIFQRDFRDLNSKQKLFGDLGVGITDIIRSCKRAENKNIDANLTDIVYNIETINSILDSNSIEKILFTSQWVEREFTIKIEPRLNRKNFKKIILPSPSPIYRRLTLKQKADIYKKHFPTVSLEFIERISEPLGLKIVKRDDN